MQTGFRGSGLSTDEEQFNTAMAGVRTAVEWSFKDVKKHFTHYAFPRKANIKTTPVALLYFVSAILWSFRASLYGSKAAKFFNCNAPSFEEYIGSN